MDEKNLSREFKNTKKKFKEFISTLPSPMNDGIDQLKIEFMVEVLRDWSIFHTVNEIETWYEENVREPRMSVKKVPLSKLDGWKQDPGTGNIHHQSNRFFKIIGLSIQNSYHREVESESWDQPIIEETSTDAGLLGIIRKRFDGIPHYLIQVKEEPGNYNLCQLSPTLQATFSNLEQAHQGRSPYFSEYFRNSGENHNTRVLRENWLSEDGGRFYKKRNYGMLVEIQQSQEITIPESYRWLSLYQIKHLLRTRSCINPHVRGILSLI